MPVIGDPYPIAVYPYEGALPPPSRIWRSLDDGPAASAAIVANVGDDEVYAAVCPHLPDGVVVLAATVTVVSPADSGLTVGEPAVVTVELPVAAARHVRPQASATVPLAGGTPGRNHAITVAFACNDEKTRVLECVLSVTEAS